MTSPDSIDITQNISLSPMTTLKVGGPARYFVRAKSEHEIAKAFEYATKNRLDVFVLGGGSNILISDNGFDGLVVQVGLKGVTFAEPGASGKVEVTAGAGEDWDSFVELCVNKDLAGVECLSGIPGFVGGTPVQNVGAYGQEVSDSIVSVRCFDRVSGEIVELDSSQCGFTYRTSIFNSTERDRYVVLSVTYKLTENGRPKITYKDLKEHFADREATLGETRESVLQIRRGKSMVIDSNDPNSRSAGSFFKNPIIEPEMFERIRSEHADIPHFPAEDNKIKIPAAWLIERSGFQKGFRTGNVGISTNHSLALVNRGGASAAEILALKEKIQGGVKDKFDILLQPEPVFVGFD